MDLERVNAIKKPLVTVIIPVYNAEKYLDKCIESVVFQDWKNVEILCIDDGSKDNSKEIISRYMKSDSRISLIETQHRGGGCARNIGINAANGEYIAFLDADDCYKKTFIREMVTRAQSTNADLVISKANSMELDGTLEEIQYSLKVEYIPEKDSFTYRDIPKHAFDSFQNWVWNKLFRREFIKSKGIHFQQLFRTNDLFFTCVSIVEAERIAVVNSALVNHRVNSGFNCQATNDDYPYDFIYAFKKLYEWLVLNSKWDEVKGSYIPWVIEGCIYNIKTIKDPRVKHNLCIELSKRLDDIGIKHIKKSDVNENWQYRMYYKIKYYRIFKLFGKEY